MSNEEEDKELRQLKLPDKAEKKPVKKSDKRWVGIILLLSVLLSLGFYFIAGEGIKDVANFFARDDAVVEVKKPVLKNNESFSVSDSLWSRVKNFWGPAVYEF